MRHQVNHGVANRGDGAHAGGRNLSEGLLYFFPGRGNPDPPKRRGPRVKVRLPSLEAALAEAEAGAGETDAGLRRLDGALAELERIEERWYEAEVHPVRGEILLKRDPADTATPEQ